MKSFIFGSPASLFLIVATIASHAVQASAADQSSGNFTEIRNQTSSVRIFKDTISQTLWTAPLVDSIGQDEANPYNGWEFCDKLAINGLKWQLPSADDYVAEEKNGLSTSLPDMNKDFLTSDSKNSGLFHAAFTKLFDGPSGKITDCSDFIAAAWRCISK